MNFDNPSYENLELYITSISVLIRSSRVHGNNRVFYFCIAELADCMSDY